MLPAGFREGGGTGGGGGGGPGLLEGGLNEEGRSGGRGSALPGGGLRGGIPIGVVPTLPGGGFRGGFGTCGLMLLDMSNVLTSEAPVVVDTVLLNDVWTTLDAM